MSIFAAYGSDTEKEEQGAWFTLRGGNRALLARSSSRRSQKALERAKAPYRELYDAAARGEQDAVPEHINDKVTAQWIATGILLDWQGPEGEGYLIGENGQELRFSAETATFLLENRRLHDLRTEILLRAGQFDAYRLTSEEEVEKNSVSGTASSRTTPPPTKPSSKGSSAGTEGASAH